MDKVKLPFSNLTTLALRKRKEGRPGVPWPLRKRNNGYIGVTQRMWNHYATLVNYDIRCIYCHTILLTPQSLLKHDPRSLPCMGISRIYDWEWFSIMHVCIWPFDVFILYLLTKSSPFYYYGISLPTKGLFWVPRHPFQYIHRTILRRNIAFFGPKRPFERRKFAYFSRGPFQFRGPSWA